MDAYSNMLKLVGYECPPKWEGSTKPAWNAQIAFELAIPANERYHPGERWTPGLALPFVIERSCFPANFMSSEVDRYLGLPGQAISYKVGERVWLDARDEAKARKGATFDLKAFHRFALDLGGMGLDQLERELAHY